MFFLNACDALIGSAPGVQAVTGLSGRGMSPST
jgi:hypothetical protein